METFRSNLLYLFCFLLFSGCQNYTVRNEFGVGKSIALSKSFVKENGQKISLIHKSIYFGTECLSISDRLKADFFTGPAITMPIDGQDSTGVGLDIMPRLRYTYWSGFEPYFDVKFGFHDFNPKLDAQGTSWGFILGGGLGARMKLFQNTWMFAEYQVWHFSNGSKIFGSHLPNPGENTDLIISGIEYRF